MSKTGMSLAVLCWVGIAALMSGCGPTRGWEVKFGINPISSVENQQKLDPKVKLVRK